MSRSGLWWLFLNQCWMVDRGREMDKYKKRSGGTKWTEQTAHTLFFGNKSLKFHHSPHLPLQKNYKCQHPTKQDKQVFIHLILMEPTSIWYYLRGVVNGKVDLTYREKVSSRQVAVQNKTHIYLVERGCTDPEHLPMMKHGCVTQYAGNSAKWLRYRICMYPL